MKAILKTLLFLLTMVILSQCEKDDPQVTIPDNNFLNALIELGFDTNGDGFISPAEAKAITFLAVSGNIISDLTGIEAFVNLDTLYCSFNLLTSLDVSNNTALEFLYCDFNQLTTLDVSNNTNLQELYCSDNQLTSLDVSINTALTYLGCYGNQLTTLDVSNNTALIYLRCGRNQLTTLDVSNNSTLAGLDLGYMPSLNMVCVWTMSFPPAGVWADITGSPNVYFTTDCSK